MKNIIYMRVLSDSFNLIIVAAPVFHEIYFETFGYRILRRGSPYPTSNYDTCHQPQKNAMNWSLYSRPGYMKLFSDAN